MKIYPENLWYLFKSAIEFLIDYKKQKKYFKNLHDLQNIIKNYSTCLSPRDLYRMKDYATRLNALINLPSKLIDHYSIKKEEKKCLTILAAFTPVYDDFIDKTKLSKAEFKNLAYNFYHYKPLSKKEELGFKLLLFGIENLPVERQNKKIQVLLKIHLTQYLSKNQKNKIISCSQTEYITKAKGGYSTLLSRYVFNASVSKEECKMWYNFGALIQLADDIFDIKKDLEEGIYTLPNNFLSPDETKIKLGEYFKTLLLSINHLKFSAVKKKMLAYRAFMFYINAVILLENLKLREKKQGAGFKFINLSNNDFEVQLWNFKNILLFLRIALTYKLTIN